MPTSHEHENATCVDGIGALISKQKRLESEHRHAQLRIAAGDALEVAEGMRLVLHGGAAVNSVLSPENRFYDESEPADMDFLTCRKNEKSSAHAFRGLLEKRGLSNLRCHPALHAGTHTVRFNNVVLADVTRVKEGDMRRMARVSGAERRALPPAGPRPPSVGRLKTVPIAYMKMSMHLELSRPAVYIERWLKVYPRLVALYRQYPACGLPTPRSRGEWEREQYPEEAAETVRGVCRENAPALTVVGVAAAGAIMTGRTDGLRIEDVVVSDVGRAKKLFPESWSWTDSPENLFWGARATGGPAGAPRHALRLIQGARNLSTNRAEDGTAFGTSDLVLQYLYAEMIDAGGDAGAPDVIDALAEHQMRWGLAGGDAGNNLSPRMTPAYSIPT